MAVRTYIPGILAVANYMKKYLNKNSTTLKERMGEGLFALCQFAVDLLIIIAEVINSGHTAGDQWGDFNEVNTIPSTTLDAIRAAIAKFWETIGVTP